MTVRSYALYLWLCYYCLGLSGGTGFIHAVVLLLSMTVRWYYCCICGCIITVCGCQVLCSVSAVALVLSVAARWYCSCVFGLFLLLSVSVRCYSLCLCYGCMCLSGSTGCMYAVALVLSVAVRQYYCCVCGCAITVCVCQVVLVLYMLLYYCYLWLSNGITVLIVAVLLSVTVRC